MAYLGLAIDAVAVIVGLLALDNLVAALGTWLGRRPRRGTWRSESYNRFMAEHGYREQR